MNTKRDEGKPILRRIKVVAIGTAVMGRSAKLTL